MKKILLGLGLLSFINLNAQVPAMVPDFVLRGDISKGGSALPYEEISAINDAGGNVYISFSSRLQDTVFLNGTALNKQADATSTIHLLKYSSSGQMLWQKAITRATGPLSFQDKIRLIWHNNRLYVTSYYSSDIDFGNSTILTNINNSMNSFVASFHADGTIDQVIKLQGYIVKTEINQSSDDIVFLVKKTAADSIILIGSDSATVSSVLDERNVIGEVSMSGDLKWHRELPESFNFGFTKGANALIFYNTDMQRHSSADSLSFPGLMLKNDAAQTSKNGYYLRFDLGSKSFSKALIVERAKFVTTEGAITADDSGNFYTVNYYGDTLNLGSQQFIEPFNKKWVVFKLNNNLDVQWIRTSTSTVTTSTDRYIRYYNEDSLMLIMVNNAQNFTFGSVSVAPWNEFMNGHTVLAYFMHMNKNGTAMNAWPVYGVYPRNLIMLNDYHVLSNGIITLDGIKILETYYPKTDQNRYVQHGWLSAHYSIGQLSNIAEKYKNQFFLLYPNPASEFVNMELAGINEVTLIHAGSGRLETLPVLQGRIDVQELRPGFYILQAKSGQGTLNAKLLIE